MKDLVKYHNDINKIPLRNFTEKEIDLLFSFIFKMREMKDDILEIDIKELCKLSGIKSRSKPRIYNQLEKTYNKILNLDMRIETETSILRFNLFRYYDIKKDKNTVEIQIESKFKYLLNELIGNYTKFELEQLVSFKSSYSKNIFRLLKQFESSKFFIMPLEEFKRLLCIPETYRNYDIDRRVFKPSMEELRPIFPNLKLEKIKKGRKLEQVKFTWGNRCPLENKEEQPVIEIKISDKLNKIIEKTKKNRFIKPLLTVSNIETLIKKYSEDLLIKGLNFATKEINYEIKALSYLEKTIDTGIENSKKKIIVESSPKNDFSKSIKKKGSLEINSKETSKGLNIDSNPTISPVEEFKGEIAKWCMKNKKYALFGELEDITSLRELGKFLEKYKIEV